VDEKGYACYFGVYRRRPFHDASPGR